MGTFIAHGQPLRCASRWERTWDSTTITMSTKQGVVAHLAPWSVNSGRASGRQYLFTRS